MATLNIGFVPRLSFRIGLLRKFSFGSSQIEALNDCFGDLHCREITNVLHGRGNAALAIAA